MWKFLPGVSKPESKRKVDTRESNKVYNATKRKRTFQAHWLQMYKWLHYDVDGEISWCLVTGVKKIGKEDTDGEFVKGTDNFKKDTLNYELEPGEK